MALNESDKKADRREKPLTKVIVRRLPPTMDQDTFLNQVSPVPDFNYIYTVKGDSSLGEYAFSRVYINFVNSEDIYNFKERFDNYVFLDSKGHEYPAVVEFASFQKIPKKRGKTRMDPKCGTIESDPIYMDFVESLNKPQEQDEKPEYTLQLTNDNKNDVTTPLLEYIKNKRAQRMKVRELRREERKKREFDRKKERYDERRKPIDEKSPVKSTVKPHVSKSGSSKDQKMEYEGESKFDDKFEKGYEKTSSYYRNKDRKYEDRRKEIKLRYPRREYPENRDFKKPDDYKEKDYRSKYDDIKKEPDTKNRKKLDEAKGKRAEENQEETVSTDDKKESNEKTESFKQEKITEGENKKETDIQSQKRIRNKDRPTIAIYRPGMLSKRKQNEGETENKEEKEGKKLTLMPTIII
ncbi:hypothetical protein NQ317_012637 [Molorchus minor]|uniref:UPF3 domain-containing protein n=1 Tax=Molorchus minor TaxID=1323400 RepID=A0ABQ9J550_9CUCU|nr:hypothetical protein NQ317_012637 [Molorchus minor]